MILPIDIQALVCLISGDSSNKMWMEGTVSLKMFYLFLFSCATIYSTDMIIFFLLCKYTHPIVPIIFNASKKKPKTWCLFMFFLSLYLFYYFKFSHNTIWKKCNMQLYHKCYYYYLILLLSLKKNHPNFICSLFVLFPPIHLISHLIWFYC